MPPPGFNFALATPAQRQYYGVPVNTPAQNLARLHVGLIGGIHLTPDVEYARAGGTWAGEVANSYLIEASAATFTSLARTGPRARVCPKTLGTGPA